MTLSIVPALKARVLAVEFVKNNPRIKALVDHPAGPFTSECEEREDGGLGMRLGNGLWGSMEVQGVLFLTTCHLLHKQSQPTVHFWAPSFKWGISLANIADYNRPPELISVPQQCGASLLPACLLVCFVLGEERTEKLSVLLLTRPFSFSPSTTTPQP